MSDLPEDLRERAIELLRREFSMAVGMAEVNLAAVNRVIPERRRYQSQDDLVRYWFSMALAQANFAVDMGLLSAEEVTQIAEEFEHLYPPEEQDV